MKTAWKSAGDAAYDMNSHQLRVVTRKTVLGQVSRSDWQRYCVTTPTRAWLSPHASYGHDPHTKLKFKRQSVQKSENKRTDGQTDRQTDGTECFIFPKNVVGNNVHHIVL